MQILKKGDAVGLISCSDGLRKEDRRMFERIERTLNGFGLSVKKAKTIFQQDGTPFSGPAGLRAAELMRLYSDHEVKAIFDVSGGDSANQILPLLDFARIGRAGTPFIGISDLSVINNAIYAKTGLTAFHYRIKNLAGLYAHTQSAYFQKAFMSDAPMPPLDYRWLRGDRMRGTVIGGNTRCFLKLAGTCYMPDPTEKIIFLESLGGGPARTASLLAQLNQLDVFHTCAGVLLGTFTQMQAEQRTPDVESLVLEITKAYHVPIAKTEQLGHGEDARCLPIGSAVTFS